MAKAAEFELGANFGQVKAQLNQVVAAMGKNIEQMQRFENRVGKTEQRMRRMARTQKSAFGDVRNFMKSWAGGMLSVGGAIATLTQSWENYQAVVMRAAKATNEFYRDTTSFAALQPPNTKNIRINEVQTLAQEYGVRDSASAYNIVQALQSAIGTSRPGLSEAQAYRQGMATAELVFRMSQLGVPLARAAETEVQGIAQGMQPGELSRILYVAGQASSRDPSLLATAAPALQFFDDKQFGASVATALAGTFAEDLKTYLKQAGIGLSGVGGAAGYFEKVGLGAATQMQRLMYLAEQGISTPEQLAKIAGVTEQRQSQALATAIQNIQGAIGVYEQIKTKASPGLFAIQRAEIEQEIPGLKYERHIAMLDARMEQLLRDPEAQEQMIKGKLRSLVLRKTGMERAAAVLPFGAGRLIDESTNQPTFWGNIAFGLMQGPFANIPGLDPTMGYLGEEQRMETGEEPKSSPMAILRDKTPAELFDDAARPYVIRRPESRDRYADDREEVVRQR